MLSPGFLQWMVSEDLLIIRSNYNHWGRSGQSGAPLSCLNPAVLVPDALSTCQPFSCNLFFLLADFFFTVFAPILSQKSQNSELKSSTYVKAGTVLLNLHPPEVFTWR